MTPPEYQPFFTASTASSAALIGLLFVAVSIAPERIFGAQAEASRQAGALSAFTALVNVFFISFVGLIPSVPIGPAATFISVPAALQTLALLLLLPSWRAEGTLRRGIVLFLGGAAVYSLEAAVGIQLWRSPSNTGSLTALLEILLGAYAIGLGRAWELLGAPRTGVISQLVVLVRATVTWARRGRSKA